MRFQINQREIMASDEYLNLDTAKLSKVSQRDCPHSHVLQCIHSVLSKRAAGFESANSFYDDVLEEMKK